MAWKQGTGFVNSWKDKLLGQDNWLDGGSEEGRVLDDCQVLSLRDWENDDALNWEGDAWLRGKDKFNFSHSIGKFLESTW